MKKIFAMLLAVIMIVQILPVSAFAAGDAPLEVVATVEGDIATVKVKSTESFSISNISFSLIAPNSCTIIGISKGADYDSTLGGTFVANGNQVSCSSSNVYDNTTIESGKELISYTVNVSNATESEVSFSIQVSAVANVDGDALEWQNATVTSTPVDIGGNGETDAEYEIYYTLDAGKADSDNNKYHEYGVNDTVSATVYIKNNTDKAVSLQAYDIYLTHDSKLTAGEEFTLPEGENYQTAVKKTDDGLHIQAIGNNTEKDENGVITADININLPADGTAVELGTITFTINSDTAEYGKGMDITLTPGSEDQGENSTNIGIADYKADGTTTGNKTSYYPSVTADVKGAEVNTKYTVTYNANAGTWGEGVTDPTQDKYHNIDMTLNPGKTPTRTGYEFKGWSTESGNDNADNAITSYKENEAVTLYAVWEQNVFKVEWFGTDGTVIETDEDVAYGDTAVFNGTQPSKTVEGYTVEFLGWNTDPDDTEAMTDLIITGETKFYPIFKQTINQYTVTFDTDGGTLADSASASVTKDYNTTITLPGVTKTGYNFEGWYDGDKKVDGDDGTYTIKADVTLTAKWTVDSYTIKYMDGTEEMPGLTPTSYTFGVGATLPTNDTVTKTGYTFAGWYDNAELTGDVVTVIATDATGDRTYWAKWTDNDYTITSIANPTEGGTVSAENEDITSGASGNMNDTINVTVKPNPGYAINKVTWAAENGNAQEIMITNGSGSFTMPAANVTVTATFNKVDLNVTKDDDITKGSVTVKNSEGTEIEKAQVGNTINLTVTPDNGYQVTEVSYTYTENGETVKETVSASGDVYSFTMPGYAIKVSATFTPIEYTITYMDGENKIADLTPDSYTVESTEVKLPETVEKKGYEFKGWYTNDALDGEVVTTINPDEAVNKTYYAKFEIINYTITYMDVNGTISGLTPNTYDVEDGTVTLPSHSKDGYSFEGWYDNSEFTGSAVESFASTDVENKTFYAKLTPIEYTITFVVPNGTAIAEQKYTIVSDYVLPEAENSNSLYTFKNWLASDAEGNWTNTEYEEGTEVKDKYGDVTLTAQWNEVLTYEIQEYKYAGSNQLMLLIATDDNTSAYTFDGQTMFYSDDAGYKISKTENGSTEQKNVFVTLISSDDVQTVNGTKRLTAAGMAKVVPDNAPAATIRTNGDINNDGVVNIADANIVYQMIVNGGAYYSADLLTADRLAADMVKSDNAVHRAAINDVNDIVNKINGATN